MEGIPPDSSVAEDVVLERAADLLALGRPEESLRILKGFSPTSDEGKAMAVYLKALVFWRSKKFDEAGKLFIAMPPATHWSAAASTLGGALCFAVSGKAQQGIDLLEKHLDTVDDDPLIEDQFVLLDQLYASVGTSDTTMLKRWAEGSLC